jgi:hypothetical protein
MRAQRAQVSASPAFQLESASRAARLGLLTHTKKKSAKAALVRPEASPTASVRPEQSLATLRDMRRRLISEERAAREVDVDRAAALAEAAWDLRILIARLDGEVSAMQVSGSPSTAAVFGIGSHMAVPQTGDILIKGVTTEYFELVEITTGKIVSGPIAGFPAALAAARATHPGAIWQQHSDERGRPLTDPFRLPDLGPRQVAQ